MADSRFPLGEYVSEISNSETFAPILADDVGEEFAYRALSRAAVVSLILAMLGLLAWISPLLLFLPMIATIFGFVALANIRKFPTELTGKPVAFIGLLVGLGTSIAAPIQHTYIYLTEVPDGYERVSFGVLKSPMGAPDAPTPEAINLSGRKIFLKGYIHPSSLASTSAKSFVLVPDWATCCFGTTPPKTHMIEVHLINEQFASKDMRRHSLAGTFEVTPYMKQIEGLDGVFYQLEADHFH